MALQCGTKAELRKTQPKNRPRQNLHELSGTEVVKPETLAGNMFRGLGFFIMAGSALVILGGLILLHPYAKLQQVQYQRDCESIRIEEARATVAARDRLLAMGPSDEVLTKRLAWSRLGMYSNNELVPAEPRAYDLPSAGTLSAIQYPPPPA